jgi:RNA-directed DNA polymerase
MVSKPEMPDGTLVHPTQGSPQGSVVSPVLADLFLHYAFDQWMVRHHPQVPFERYADDIVCHCNSQAEAESLRKQLQERLAACRLELHPEKTRVVYCADANRHEDYEVRRFDSLGYTFKPREAMNRYGKLFTNFSPAVSDKASKAMRRTIRKWGISRQNRCDLAELAARISAMIVGWVRYYGLFQPSTLQGALRTLDYHLVQWARRKYKRLRGHRTRAWEWLAGLRRRAPKLFPHWSLAIQTTER